MVSAEQAVMTPQCHFGAALVPVSKSLFGNFVVGYLRVDRDQLMSSERRRGAGSGGAIKLPCRQC